MRNKKEKSYTLHVFESCNIVELQLLKKRDGTHEYR